MQAAICTAYGVPEGMQLREVEQPVPQENEVRIRIHATTVTSADVRIRKADPFLVRLFYGLTKPKPNTILGAELAGEIEAIGRQVQHFKVGDSVFAGAGIRMGANAEYLCLPEDGAIALKPAHLTDEEAAAIPFGATTALTFLREKGKLQSGQTILIYGASGAVGTAAVQLAKAFGATVTGVCSTANVALVKSLGADDVIDYTQETIGDRSQTYDLIFDTVGKSPFADCVRSLQPTGVYLRAVHFDPWSILRGQWVSLTSRKRVIGGVAIERQADLIVLKELIEAGKLRAVIDRRYPLAQIADAHRYVDQGHKRGAVVLTLAPPSPAKPPAAS